VVSKYRQHYQPEYDVPHWWEVVMTIAIVALIGVMLAY